MSKIIKIQIANPKAFRLNFVMTRSCPYTCKYCPEELHARQHTKINTQDLETFLLRFKDRNGAIQITGGECTTHPQFTEVIETARKANFKVLVDSNSVRTYRFYDEVKHLVDNWCITLHPSQHKLDLEKLKLLSQHSFLVVYVAMDPEHWETALDWYNQVSQLTDLKVTPIKVMDDWAGAKYKANYTQEQLDILSTMKSKWLFTSERESVLRKTHMWLADTESKIFYDDDTVTDLDAFELIRTNKNSFLGWTCNAGNESICIFEDGQAIWANCGIKRYDHYLDVFPEELSKPVKCTYLQCGCGTDIRSSKEK